ncbi:hypothetical protein PC120_g15950 [Phytophthora cactorum]|nr:hypothetical protein PC120_g15950 [Phytophthora cactorum]
MMELGPLHQRRSPSDTSAEFHQALNATGSQRSTRDIRSTRSVTPRPFLPTRIRSRRRLLFRRELGSAFSAGSSACRPPALAVAVTDPSLSSFLEDFSDDGSDGSAA